MLGSLLKKNIELLQKFITEIRYKNDISFFFKTINNIYKKNNKFSFNNKILIECYWDNPGYWLSLSLVLNALSTCKSKCIAVVSHDKNKFVILKRLKLLGIRNIIFLEDYISVNKESYDLDKIHNENDLLKFKLPYGFSNDILYDEFCRYQKSPYVLVNHLNFKEDFQTFLNVIFSSEKIFKTLKPKYLISSHNVGVYYGSLVNAAIRNKSKVIVLYTLEHSFKFLQFKQKNLQHSFERGPKYDEFKNLNSQKKISLRKFGNQYMKDRFAGKADDAGAMFAYINRKRIRINKKKLKETYHWNNKYPIITIFSHAYMDFQRSYGWNTFKNFLEYNLNTISYLLEKKNIYLIFKNHPGNELYAKIKETRDDYIKNRFKSKNLIIADVEWDNTDLIKLSDGIITYTGTVGIEATHLNKPVLCGNKGWYGHINFTKYAKSKKDLFRLIDNKFWEMSKECIQENRKKSDEFSGWIYSNPIHSKSYVIPDPIYVFKNFKILKDWIKQNSHELDLEINCLKKWISSNDFSYHTWKIKNKKWK